MSLCRKAWLVSLSILCGLYQIDFVRVALRIAEKGEGEVAGLVDMN